GITGRLVVAVRLGLDVLGAAAGVQAVVGGVVGLDHPGRAAIVGGHHQEVLVDGGPARQREHLLLRARGDGLGDAVDVLQPGSAQRTERRVDQRTRALAPAAVVPA
ncbi:MAG: hypothetical protein ACK56I_15230, partial [bacterium]